MFLTRDGEETSRRRTGLLTGVRKLREHKRVSAGEEASVPKMGEYGPWS